MSPCTLPRVRTGILPLSSPTLARQLRELRPLEDVTVHEGGSATFQLELSQEGVTGEWAQGGVRLHPGPKCHIHSEGRTHCLVLSGLGLADSGCISFTSDTLRCAARLTVRGEASGPLPTKSLCVTTDLTMWLLLTALTEWGIPWTLWICVGHSDHLA